MQSIKALKKIARKLERKVNQEKRRQEVVVALYQNINSLNEEYHTLRQNGTEIKLYQTAADSFGLPITE